MKSNRSYVKVAQTGDGRAKGGQMKATLASRVLITLTVVAGMIVAIAPPASASTWVHAGRVVQNGNGMTITVDMDSMVSAGPGRMRTWIKFQNDRPDADGVKETLIYEQLDCARSYHATMSLYAYAADGHIVRSERGG